MKKYVRVFLVVFNLLLFFACKKEEKIPACIEAKIKVIESDPIQSIPVEIWQYKYKRQTVYYIFSNSYGYWAELLDENCNTIMAHLIGCGFTGKCNDEVEDFFVNRKNEKFIWKNKRVDVFP